MRSRNIKPGYFKNEYLAECDPLARILFAGLWCMADREGRMEYRPKRIKAELLPYDNTEIESLIKQLENMGFILLYEINSNKYLQILAFLTHQNPHCKESASTVPAPDLHSTSPADSLNLIPDSLIPHSDSNGERETKDFNIEQLKDYLHAELPELGLDAQLVSGFNFQIISSFIDEIEQFAKLEVWKDYVERIKISDWLMRRQTGKGQKKSKMTLKWLCSWDTYGKVMSGNYDTVETIKDGSEIL